MPIERRGNLLPLISHKDNTSDGDYFGKKRLVMTLRAFVRYDTLCPVSTSPLGERGCKNIIM